MNELFKCEICKQPINSNIGITLLGNKSYHPNCFKKRNADKNSLEYILLNRNAFVLLRSYNYYILGIKKTRNIGESKRTDILIIDKKTKKEFLIYNWKRVFHSKPKRTHYWHYEVYSNEELIIDGEYTVKDERKGRQYNLINHLFKELGLK